MRLEKVSATLALAKSLASDPEGLTIDDIRARFNVSRRTAERMRDIVEAVFGPLERLEDGRRIRFRISSGGLGRFTLTPTAAEMAEVLNLARAMKDHDPARAELLESLAAKVTASLRPKDRNRLAPDIEAHLETEIWAHIAGPKIACSPSALKTIREAILRQRLLQIEYRRVGQRDIHSLRLAPLGIIFGRRHYLVGCFPGTEQPRLLRLDRTANVQIDAETICRPNSFSLKAYAEQSFGTFQEQPEAIELVFHSEAAREALDFQFHPRQQIEEAEDGTIHIRFVMGGLQELAEHLLKWSGSLKAVSPPRLAQLLQMR